MVDRSFFNESMEQSIVKASITQKYFWAWANVIIPTAKRYGNKIGYIDLFAGPGRYKDGAKSTPILILEKAVTHPFVSKMLVSMFNDVDANNTSSLEEAIASIPNIQNLQYKPQILNLEVNEELVKQLESVHFIPSLFFIDPWGYKALSIKLFSSIIKDWGCDCIFFFNYNRINMGINNDFVTERMNSLFGKSRADKLRPQLANMNPEDRELAIVEAICDSLRDIGGKYPLPFRFRKRDRDSTSHHLIFVSKNVKGYTIMKEIMAKESSTIEQGVASFEYNPSSALHPLLFSLSQPLNELADMLLNEFAGENLT
ncbi:MAG: three-Cys-motif partner protein TcmP, partial [Pseudanabaena sp.]